MAFDPNKFIEERTTKTEAFNPDEFLKSREKAFSPDEFLKERAFNPDEFLKESTFSPTKLPESISTSTLEKWKTDEKFMEAIRPVEDKLPATGFFRNIKQEWTGEQLKEKTPIIGGLYGLFNNVELMDASNRLQDKSRYEEAYLYELQEAQTFPSYKVAPREDFIKGFIKQDQKALADYFKYIGQNRTFMGNVARGISNLPTWAAEFWMTGGLYSLGDDAAKAGGIKLMRNYGRSKMGRGLMKTAAKTTGWTLGTTLRSTGLAPRVLEKVAERRLQVELGIRRDEGLVTSMLKGYGDIWIEAGSEVLGGLGRVPARKVMRKMMKRLPFGSEIIGKLRSAWLGLSKKNTAAKFANKILTKTGYNGIIGEFTEERLATIMKGITDVEDFGAGKDANWLERINAGLQQDKEGLGPEIVVLSTPGSAG